MGKYTVIADVSQKIADLLSEGMVPDLIADKNGIGLCGPDEKGDFSVGIYLYNIEENNDFKRSGMVNISYGEQKFPPVILSLYYMITAYSVSDIKFRAIQEQRILGRVMQILSDNSIISGEDFGNEVMGADIRIELLDLSTEEKMKLWNDTTKPYKTSLCYRVTPVELESTKGRRISRVTEFTVELKDGAEEKQYGDR